MIFCHENRWSYDQVYETTPKKFWFGNHNPVWRNLCLTERNQESKFASKIRHGRDITTTLAKLNNPKNGYGHIYWITIV